MSSIILEILFIVIITAQKSTGDDRTTKGLPVGQRSIAYMSLNNYVYVDKTSYILEMLKSGQFYFLARPSKFGKTLLVDTLKEIFRGNKKYFNGTAIYKSDYQWHRSTVLHFDFSKFDCESPKTLKNSMKKLIVEMAKTHNMLVAGPSTEAQLNSLISKVADKTSTNTIVILVDDYDAPIIKNLAKPDLAEEMRQTLASFFDVIRSCRQRLRFLFVTGVSKFSLSLSSRSIPNDNILQDLTLDAKYAAMMGYTEDEFKNSFQNDIRRMVASYNKTKTKGAIVNETRAWYKGYQFSKNQKMAVYNPWSVLNYLDHQEAADYWHRASRDTLHILLNEMKKSPSKVIPVLTSKVCESRKSLTSWITRVEKDLPFVPFMFHTGYLSINGYNAEDGCYVLDFPNKEVREGFFNVVLLEFVGCDVDMLKLGAAIIQQSLADYFFQAFVDQVNEFLGNSPTKFMSSLANKADQDVFRRLGVFMILKYCFPNCTSVSSDFTVRDSDRAEVVINLTNVTYVLDLKYDKVEPLRTKTSDLQLYKSRFQQANKLTVFMTINFSSKLCRITDWLSVLLRGQGVKKKFYPKGVEEEDADPEAQTSIDTTVLNHSEIMTSVVPHEVGVTEIVDHESTTINPLGPHSVSTEKPASTEHTGHLRPQMSTVVEKFDHATHDELAKTGLTGIQRVESTATTTFGPHSVTTSEHSTFTHPENLRPKMSTVVEKFVPTTHDEPTETEMTGIHHDKSTIGAHSTSTRKPESLTHPEGLGPTMSKSERLKESTTSVAHHELTKTKTMGVHHDQSTRITTIPHSVPTSRLTSFARHDHVKPYGFDKGIAHGETTKFKFTGIPHDEPRRITTLVSSSVSRLRPTYFAHDERIQTRITPAPNELLSSTTITTSDVSHREIHKKNESSTESPRGIRGFFSKLFNKFG